MKFWTKETKKAANEMHNANILLWKLRSRKDILLKQFEKAEEDFEKKREIYYSYVNKN